MLESRAIFRHIENVPSDLMRPPPKITSSPIPSKNFSESPNKSFDKENYTNEFTYKTVSFASFKPDHQTEASCKLNDDISEKMASVGPIKEEQEGKFQILLEQNQRLIEIVNESIEEKEFWREKYERMENRRSEDEGRIEEMEKREKEMGNLECLRGMQEGIREIKGYFYHKLGNVLRENEELKQTNRVLIEKNHDLEEELEYKRDLIEKFETELVETKLGVKDLNDIFKGISKNKQNNDYQDQNEEINMKDFESNIREIVLENKKLTSDHERLSNITEEQERQMKLLQEKLCENQDFALIRDQLTKKAEKYKNLKEKYDFETISMKTKLEESQKELLSIKNKYQILFKESNERIQTLSLHYEEAQKSFENEVEKNYEDEKNRLMSCLIEERQENHNNIKKLEEKLRNSENEINDLKDNINMELEELGGKYSLQQDKYREKEIQMVNEIKRLNVIFQIF